MLYVTEQKLSKIKIIRIFLAEPNNICNFADVILKNDIFQQLKNNKEGQNA